MYCPRRFGLLEINEDWRENALVVKGNLVHERVHGGGHSFSSKTVRAESSVQLYNDELDIFGVADCVEFRPDKTAEFSEKLGGNYKISLVEYKPTRPKNGEISRPDAIQVFAQKICADGIFGVKCEGVLYYADVKRSFDTTEVVLDEDVRSGEATRALGVEVGDIVCFEPRTRITESGYIKSRFLDDKLSVGILLGFAKYIRDNKVELPRRVYVHVTVYEEVGHGGAGSVPAGVTEAISVDMGCVGDGVQCTERQVSICAKDSGGPYSYEVVGKLIDAAKKEGADYAVDVYPHYGSDVEATLGAGNDVRHGLIGSGVYASHGYERSHKDGVMNTLLTLKGYLGI